ncbi:hypothetical protein [Kutzneria sp. NPDC052558]|uniref:hypothetical protein n=1 Tax=Kutzneria sp. NPDC052558 TaxID=3364121 RepID=UPI0037CA9304
MPHRLSLTRRLAALRRPYTGETDSTLLPAVGRALKTLSGDERARMHEILNEGYETRLLGESSIPAVNHRFREALLPDTTDTVQQQLEAGILFALGQTAPYRWPATEVASPMPLSRIVEPGLAPDETILHLCHGVLAPMMAALTPRVVDGSLQGLAGLRATVKRRQVQLHLADAGPTRKVALSNTGIRHWVAALAFTRKVIGSEQLPDLERRLNWAERSAIRTGCRVPVPAALASGVLRRLPILGSTYWLTVRPDGPEGLRLDWAGGRSPAKVAAALVHPLAGLAGGRFHVTPMGADFVTVIVTGIPGEPTTKLTLHQAPVTARPPFTRIDVSDAQAEFKRAMTAPAFASIHRELVSR